MKLLHFADLHLDAPFAWARAETARLRRRNRRETLTRLLQLADEERVDAILCGGDLFEHERVSPDTIEFLRSSFGSTSRPFFVAPGNHDWFSARSPYALVGWPANVHIFTESRLAPMPLADGLTLWGAAHRAPANTDGFFAGFRPDRGGVHLALAHASERGVLGWQESGKQPHAPFDSTELEAAGIAHAFLGHYHVPRDADRYTYPGNPDPLEFGESGERGAIVAVVGRDGSVTRERRVVAVSAVHDVQVRLNGASHADEVAEALSHALIGLTGCVRATLCGEVASNLSLELRDLERLGDGLDAFVLRVGDLATGYALDEIENEATVRGQFVRDARAQIEDAALRRRVILTGLRALEGRRDLEVA